MKLRSLAWAAVLCLCMAAPAARAAMDPRQTQANVYFNLGYKKFQENDLDAALKSLDKALQAVPNHQQSNFLKGVILIQKRRFTEAIPHLETVTQAQAGNADAWNNLGVAYYSTDRWAEAETAFKKTAELSPDRADVHLNLGIIAVNKDTPEGLKEAVDSFERAAALDPSKPEAWRGLGQAYFRQGNLTRTAQAYETSLSLAPDVNAPDAVDLRLHLADLYFNQEDFENLKRVLAPLEQSANAEVRFFFGVIAYREGRFDESRGWFEKALEVRENYPEARFNLAITLYDQGDYEGALKQFEEVLRFNPSDKQARENLDITRQVAVQSFLKRGSENFIREDYFEALQTWQRALALDPQNRVALDLVETAKIQAKSQAEDLVAEGRSAAEKGEVAAALRAWSRALEIEPGNQAAKQGLVQVRGKAAELMAAVKVQFEDELGKRNWVRSQALAGQAMELDKDAGRELLERVSSGRLAEARELAAQAASVLDGGEVAEAVRLYERVLELAPEDAGLKVEANKAKVHIRREVTRALSEAKKAEEAENYSKAYEGYRRALELQPENSEAMEGVKKSSRLAKIEAADPKKLNDMYYEGVYAFAAGDNQKASTLWKEVLKLDKNHQLSKAALRRVEARIKALQAVE